MYPMVGAEQTRIGAGAPCCCRRPARSCSAALAGEDVTPTGRWRCPRRCARRYPADLVAAALTQQALRVAARAKFSRAEQMLFTRAGLEQASSELTARHAAARFAGARLVADLCCGIGGNLPLPRPPPPAPHRLPPRHRHRPGPRRDRGRRGPGQPGVRPAQRGRLRARCARRVPPRRRARLPLGGFDAVFIDPARRDGRRRLPPGQYRPPLDWCLRLAATVPRVGIKAAPGHARASWCRPDGRPSSWRSAGS